MAKAKTTVEVTTPTLGKIEVLDKVYFVDGSFYRTEGEAKLSLLKSEMYEMYLKRQYPGPNNAANVKSYLASAAAIGFKNNYVYIDDVIKLLADKGVSFENVE